MKAYKLTDEKGQTKNDTQWGINVTHSASGEGKQLCTNGWIHFYVNPLIAVLMNPAHAGFVNPILWECETSGQELHRALKAGCKTLTTIKQIELPVIAINSKITFGILCAKKVCSDLAWNTWADSWLAGKDRTADAAYAAYAAAYAAAEAAYAAAEAAYAAADAAKCAAAKYAADAGVASAYAAGAAKYAADADAGGAAAGAAYAAKYAAGAAGAVSDFIEIANQAMLSI